MLIRYNETGGAEKLVEEIRGQHLKGSQAYLYIIRLTNERILASLSQREGKEVGEEIEFNLLSEPLYSAKGTSDQQPFII